MRAPAAGPVTAGDLLTLEELGRFRRTSTRREHHLVVFVPCWKLPEVHALLLAKDLAGRMERAAAKGWVP